MDPGFLNSMLRGIAIRRYLFDLERRGVKQPIKPRERVAVVRENFVYYGFISADHYGDVVVLESEERHGLRKKCRQYRTIVPTAQVFGNKDYFDAYQYALRNYPFLVTETPDGEVTPTV